MLRTLSIRDFVIVDSLELDFGRGFSVLTGETGAGKSILVDALALALGGRGDASVVREGATRADISVEFASNNAIGEWLDANGFEHDDGAVLLRRVIDSNGRSRCFINGTAATAAQLRELGEMLVDIHGQHAHQSLLKNSHQRELLDRHAGLQELASAVASAYAAWQKLARDCREFEANAETHAAQREHLEWQVNELERLAPKPGEWTDITQEHSRLAHAASLIAGAQEAIAVLAESENPLISQLFLLHQKLSRLSDVDQALKPVLDFIESARIQLQEASSTLNHYLSKVELDPQRLQQVETRMEAIHNAARKFRVEPEALPAEFALLSEKLAQMAPAGNLDELRQMEIAAQQIYQQAAQR